MEVKISWGESYTIAHKETEVRQFAFDLGRIDRILTTNGIVGIVTTTRRKKMLTERDIKLKPGEIQMHKTEISLTEI